MMNVKVWKPIKDYEGLYEISNFGEVKSLYKEHYCGCNHNTLKIVNEHIMSPRITNTGYHRVGLYKNGIGKDFYIHRLVAIHFICNKNNHKEINHIDENKGNNQFKNLEWCSREYNCNYGDGIQKRSKSKCKKIIQYDLKMNFIKEWDSGVQTTVYGYSSNLISKCCHYNRESYKGYIWRFKDDL